MEESKKQPVVISKQTGLFLDCINKTNELSCAILDALISMYDISQADETYRDVFYEKIAAIEDAIDIYFMRSVREKEAGEDFICLEETEETDEKKSAVDSLPSDSVKTQITNG